MYTDTRPLRFPQDILQFLVWAPVDPMKLYLYLYETNMTLTSDSSLRPSFIWSSIKTNSNFITVARLALLNIFVISYALPMLGLIGLQLSLGIEFDWFAAILVLSTGTFLSFVLGLEQGMTLGMSLGSNGNLTVFVPLAVALGISFGVAFSICLGPLLSLGLGALLTVLNIEKWVVFASALIITVFMSFLFVYPNLLFSLIGLFFIRFQTNYSNIKRLPFLAIIYRNINLGLDNLDVFLIELTTINREQGLNAIVQTAISNGPRNAQRALLELVKMDMHQAESLERISEIVSTLPWLPDGVDDDLNSFLSGLELVSRHALAVIESETIYNRQEQLRSGKVQIDQLIQGLASSDKVNISRATIPALHKWQIIFQTNLESISQQETIPNVYVSGSPLVKDSKVFKGRKDLFRTLTNELITPADQRPSLLLFGARRMGKTSTLKQLPVHLGPQILPVSVDLQKASTVENATGLLYLIAREIIKSAYEERRLCLPELGREALENDPYLAFQEWLEIVESELGNYYWVLLSLDEFESLGEMLASGRIDERVFQLLRGIIQGHPRITVLMSGAHTLEELPPLWSNYLINTRMLKVGPLAEADARELILRPIPDFPLTYDDEAVELLLRETGCHPNWLQFTCREVVETLNNENRFHALRGDVETALGKVPQVLAGDFKDLWEGRDSSDLMRAILKTIATDKKEAFPESGLEKFAKKEADFQKTLDFLLRRDLLVHENGLYWLSIKSGIFYAGKQPK